MPTHDTQDAPGLSTGRQLTLWATPAGPAGRVLPRPTWHRTSPLSRQAARRAEPRAGTRKADVLNYVRSCGQRGATREQLSLELGIAIQSICPAVRALLDEGHIVETAESRPTKQHAAAAVLIVPDLEGPR